MRAAAIALGFAFDGCTVRLRELNGHDERRIVGTTTADALQLLDAVIEPLARENPPPRAEDLVAADRDRLLAALYQQAFGDRIEATLKCEGCSEPFDIHFSLRELIATVEQRPRDPSYLVVGPNLFQTAAGHRFRVPTGRDESAAAAAASPDSVESSLLQRCVVDPTAPLDAAALQEALDEVAPLLEFELRASCPECQRVHLVQFDIQTYLLRSLLGEQDRLAAELHRIALAYGWSPDDILSLHRSERRQLVALIENETTGRRRPR